MAAGAPKLVKPSPSDMHSDVARSPRRVSPGARSGPPMVRACGAQAPRLLKGTGRGSTFVAQSGARRAARARGKSRSLRDARRAARG